MFLSPQRKTVAAVFARFIMKTTSQYFYSYFSTLTALNTSTKCMLPNLMVILTTYAAYLTLENALHLLSLQLSSKLRNVDKNPERKEK